MNTSALRKEPTQGYEQTRVAPLHVIAPTYAVRLDFFEGPLDLLLHLIQQREVSVEEVEMAEIAEQFLLIISQARQLDLEKATEYLVIAATLLSIKSQTLLPASAFSADDELLNAEPGTEFYEQLRARLRLYELTKQRAQELVQRPQLGIDTFSRRVKIELPPESQEEGAPQEEAGPFEQEDSNTLTTLFARLLRRVGAGMSFLRVRLEPISVVKYMMQIVDAFQGDVPSSRRTSFSELLRSFTVRSSTSGQGSDHGPKTAPTGENSERALKIGFHERIAEGHRGTIIGSFVAVLELVRRGIITATQAPDSGEIQLGLRINEEEAEAEVGVLTEEQVEAESMGQNLDGSKLDDSLLEVNS
jgi:chromatin segregation and condensation protein Rec8/ScpA/Scc1 (kleisin family)